MRFVLSSVAGLILGIAPLFFSSHAADLSKEPALQENFSGVDILDSRVWVVGYYGTLLYSADGGSNWSAQSTGTTEHLFGLTALNEQTAWAVGNRGTILHTQDGGRSWINASLSEDLTLSSVAFVNSTKGWIVGEFGVIFQTPRKCFSVLDS